MEFRTGSCVAIGNFNPAIIQPRWLVQQQVLQDGPVETRVKPGFPPSPAEFKFQGLVWRCSTQRLEVATDNSDAPPGPVVAEVIRLLSHTPITAVGNNFEFILPSKMREKTLGAMTTGLEGQFGEAGYRVAGRSVRLTLEMSDCSLNITAESDGKLPEVLSLNFHRGVDGKRAAGAAKQWGTDLAIAHEVLSKVWGED